MIVALTSASLDITLGVAWWTIKQVFSGAIYLGSYLFSESSTSKKHKILGDDPNFVPHAFKIIELEVSESHTTLSKHDDVNSEPNSSINNEEFVEISKTDCILTTKEKYFCVPIASIIQKKDKLPLWIIPFLNTYPLTNYTVIQINNNYSSKHHTSPVFSPFTLHKHLNINPHPSPDLYVYLKHDDVETVIKCLQYNI
jgi:hypothetical protein